MQYITEETEQNGIAVLLDGPKGTVVLVHFVLKKDLVYNDDNLIDGR